ncbi:hypothetical protein RRG08_025271 [Elysia crispata]|uniref:DDE-1 domain-containing protein n=2 Tax=Elysia crispata TaxID=231223 RepID=A0AAE1DVP6_9GAST|nr:hypothetical protein RRG08_025271 [Elysia crispata]
MKYVRPSEETPVILTIDNHENHLSIEAVELAHASHIHMITSPPHTSNETQPLDRTVFGPVKAAFNRFADSWVLQNVGKTITIYETALLSGKAWTKAAHPENIISGFKASGMWPFNREVFNNEDYLPSEITNRPVQPPKTAGPSNASAPPSPSLGLNHQSLSLNTEAESSTSNLPDSAGLPTSTLTTCTSVALTFTDSGTSSPTPAPPKKSATLTSSMIDTPTMEPQSMSPESSLISPSDFGGLPKAGPRKDGACGRKKGRSMVATSTPELQRMKAEADTKANKRSKDEKNSKSSSC